MGNTIFLFGSIILNMEIKKAKQIAKLIKESDKVAFFHHQRPDWDTVSSSYALAEAVKKMWPEKKVAWIADVEEIKANRMYNIVKYKLARKRIDKTWTAVVGDVNGKDRIYKYEEYEKAGKKICFDHHRSTIDFDHDIVWQEPTLGASSVQSFEIAKALGVKFDSKLAISFMAGILTDTGFLAYSLADPRPAQAIAELLVHIDNEDLRAFYRDLRTKSVDDITVIKYIYNNMKIEDKVAYIYIKEKDLKKIGIEEMSVKANVNTLGNIEGVEAWAMFKEDLEENVIKGSIRSLGANINEVAKKYGGGGHIQASGVMLERNWKKVDLIINDVKKAAKKYAKGNK